MNMVEEGKRTIVCKPKEKDYYACDIYNEQGEFQYTKVVKKESLKDLFNE